MDLNEGSALGVFTCELCELSSSHSFYGQKPPNTRAIVYTDLQRHGRLEECYGMKDPFSPERERSFSFWDLSAVCAAKRCVWERTAVCSTPSAFVCPVCGITFSSFQNRFRTRC